MDEAKQALRVCPERIRAALERFPRLSEVEEIRLRVGRAVTVNFRGRETSVGTETVTPRDLQEVLEHATGQAVYAAQDMLKNGFLTVPGGHRLGLCGTAVYRNGEVFTLRDLSSVDIRVARQIFGAADGCADFLWTHPRSTLIVGAPGRGKTTLLRDFIRQCSDRFGWRIGVADERMELGACVAGTAQFDLGAHTDILSGVRKETAIEMLVRSMNPQWIAVDEITAAQDIEAMQRASYCGVRFFATAHAATLAELEQRPLYRRLLESGTFENTVVIGEGRTIEMQGRRGHA